ncbi:Glycosyl hydrolase [Trema orientale]|uniref:Glycosyl hydrolase n=1 Tax=Trema orientale TaxID=63057 RepID=A0A2P5EI52_TREOI|nr:Glycosyl hydrolase [Trema orientale]
MTITAVPVIKDGSLMVRGKVVLTGVPRNVVVSPLSNGSAFIGATSAHPSSRHVFSLGILEGFKFLSLFRFKLWWMIPRVGKSASEIPMETQMLLLEAREESALEDEVSSEPTNENAFYTLFLPVLDGMFRASLEGSRENELRFCVESGDDKVQTSKAMESIFVNSGDNPFELIRDSIKILEKNKGTFSHIENKKEGGCSPKFLIIDDGWQDTVNEFRKEGQPLVEGTQYVYMWHALAGYWGGVLPSSETMGKYNPKIAFPIQSPGNTGNLRDIAMDSLEKYGVGLVDPEKIFEFYNDLHSYLASCGADGVKVDVQNLLETLGSGYGGRVSITRRYQEALEQSVARNFRDNNLICCMSHNSDSIFSSKKSAVARASEDFMPREPTFQTLHIASVAFNSLLLGEIVVPDWDMFHSKHETAEFHGAARALGGCAVYVSDKPGNQDFKILKKLVLPDGSVLRARYAGRPTRDCLFEDPVMDGKRYNKSLRKTNQTLRFHSHSCSDNVLSFFLFQLITTTRIICSLMKIWNLNKLSGVVGVFNCQGAGSWPLKNVAEDINFSGSTNSSISGHVRPIDVEFLEEIAGESWNGDCAIYAFNSGSLSTLPQHGNLEVSLATLQCEIYTISPIKVFGNGQRFAPIGLLDMYNSGGAVESLSCREEFSGFTVTIKGRGVGRFGAYSSSKPKRCKVDQKEDEFTYNAEDGLLIVKLQGECGLKDIEFVY